MEGMQQLADRILYTPGWEAAQLVAMMLGFGCIFIIVLGGAKRGPARVFAFSGIGLMLLGVMASMFFEEIVFTWPELPQARKLPYLLSFAGFLLFIVMLIHSATKLVTGGLFVYFPRLFTRGEQRAEAVAALRPGFLWGLASAVLFALSLIGYHGLDLMLGRTVTAGG